MGAGGFTCSGCGSSNVTFDPKMRLVTCNQCGKEEYYTRATLNANNKVVLSRQNAINFFVDGKLQDARHYALDILNISMDNIPALYMMAYYDEYVDRHYNSIHDFFETAVTVAIEYDELEDMKKLIKATAYRLTGFEDKVIEFFAKNMQGDEDRQDLCEVLDALCPYFISRRTSSDYLKTMAGLYSELAEHCGIPKTCFALLKSIDTNPDSPYVNNTFYLKSKSQYFYDQYILPIGEVIEHMPANQMKAKFIGAYRSKVSKYKADASIS